MVTKSKAPTTLEEAPETTAESAPAEATQPAAAATDDDKKEKVDPVSPKKKNEKKDSVAPVDGAKEGGDVEKKKPKKKVIPSWATFTNEERSKLSKSSLAKPKIQDAIVDAIKLCGNNKGVASASAIASMILTDNPECPRKVIKKAMLKAIASGAVTQVKGNGFSGSFKLGNGKPAKAAGKNEEKGKKGKKDAGPRKDPLENLFPLVFTWAVNPKEASVGFIKKYLDANYPDLDLGFELKHYKKALESAESNGQLERLTGKGYSGTFRLIDGANKLSSKFGDAFENALIAMNEPKELSVSKLRDYLGFYHSEYLTNDRPKVLKSALDRAVDKGWLKQISGKGFSGSYRLMHPYYPSPKELWGSEYKETKEKADNTEKPKRKVAKKVVESESEDDDEEEEEAYKPSPKKRGAPTPRSTAAPKPKKAKTEKKEKKAVVAKKSKPAAKGRKGKK